MGKIYSTVPEKLPIEIEMKYGGDTLHYLIKAGTRVKCMHCHRNVTINKNTVCRFLHPYDTRPKVRCKICSRLTDIAYYCNDESLVKIETWDAQFVKTTMEVTAND